MNSKTITVPKSMPLTERISEVSSQISEWLDSFGEISDADRKTMRLRKAEQIDKEYKYHYSVSLGEELSAANAKTQIRSSPRPKALKAATTLSQTERPKTGLPYFHQLSRTK
jgi:hypothetical protein